MRILFFDGYCNLCNGLVEWLIRTDMRRNFQFASLQGLTARDYLKWEQAPSNDELNTVIYFRDGKRLEKSTAILMVFHDIGGVWRAAKLFLILPRPIRDLLYTLVARNRYRLFGKRTTCRLPSPEEKERFLP